MQNISIILATLTTFTTRGQTENEKTGSDMSISSEVPGQVDFLCCGLRLILVYPNPYLKEDDLTLTYRLNRLDEPISMAVSKPMLTEFGIHHRLERYV